MIAAPKTTHSRSWSPATPTQLGLSEKGLAPGDVEGRTERQEDLVPEEFTGAVGIPGASSLQIGLVPFSPGQRHWGPGEGLHDVRLLEAHVLSAVTGVQGLPAAGTRGRLSICLRTTRTRMLQTGSFQAAKEGDPKLAASNPKGLEGWDGLTPCRGSGKQQSSVAQLVADGADEAG